MRVPPLGGALPGLRVTAEAVAAREPAVAAATGDPDDTGPDGPGRAHARDAGPDASGPDGPAPGRRQDPTRQDPTRRTRRQPDVRTPAHAAPVTPARPPTPEELPP